MDYYLNLLGTNDIVLCLTCIVVQFNYKKYKHTPLVLAPAILWLGLLTEVLVRLHHKYVGYQSLWMIHIYDLLFYGLFFRMLYLYLKDKRLKRAHVIISITLLVAYVIRLFTLDSLNDRTIYTDTLAVLIFVVFTAMYLVETLKSRTHLQLKKHPEYIFIGGYLIFSLIYAPLNIAYDTKFRIFSDGFYINLKSIQIFWLLFMYVTYIVLFTRMKKLPE